MNKINEIIKKETHRLLKEECFRQDLLKEGIIPNYIKKTVKLTMDNNDGVDFSEDNEDCTMQIFEVISHCIKKTGCLKA